jgi:imidazole glycerol-phosphate synthase subunit HisH
MRTVGIIDYGLCNIDSIRRATEVLGGAATVTRDPDALRHFDLLILPGVGSFGAAMANLSRDGLDAAAREAVANGTPLLGICLGMQLLGDSSMEGGSFQGLSLIPGKVVELVSTSDEERIPHMGWNSIEVTRNDPILKGIESGTDFYFVHSFHLQAEEQHVLARTPYCGGFVSIVRRNQVWGTQFHPEKSWPNGHSLLSNFISES